MLYPLYIQTGEKQGHYVVEYLTIKKIREIVQSPSLTESAPGNNRLGVSRGNALQDGRLVNSEGEVLRAHQDDGLFVDRRLGACVEGE